MRESPFQINRKKDSLNLIANDQRRYSCDYFKRLSNNSDRTLVRQEGLRDHCDNVSSMPQQNNRHSDELFELSQPARIIIGINEKKFLNIPVEHLKKHLRTHDIREVLYNAILRGASLPRGKTSDKDIRLTIFTEVSWGTLGDYYAALRLISLLQLNSLKLTIHWIIKGKIEEIPDELSDSNTLLIQKIENWETIFITQEIIDNLWKAQAILVFPTFHFLTIEHLETLRKKFNKPIISCLEYSYAERKNMSMIELQTGLGEDEMGIFVLSQDKQHPLTQINRKYPIMQVLFHNLDVTQDTDVALANDLPLNIQEDNNSINDTIARHYDETHFLFFGYANKELTRVINGGVNVVNFIETCLAIAEASHQKKNIDIIVPITYEQLIAFNFDYSKYRQVYFIYSKNGVTQNVLCLDEQRKNLPILRIINLFRFDNKTFQRLIAASHPFKLCTGDQSLSDVISVENTIPFYQVMEWKKSLLDNYLLIAKKALQEANIDLKESFAIKYLVQMSTLQFLSLIQLKEIVIAPKLLLEFKVIHRYIIEHKNLNKTLPDNLINFLHYLKSEAFFSEEEEVHVPKMTSFRNGFFSRAFSIPATVALSHEEVNGINVAEIDSPAGKEFLLQPGRRRH